VATFDEIGFLTVDLPRELGLDVPTIFGANRNSLTCRVSCCLGEAIVCSFDELQLLLVPSEDRASLSMMVRDDLDSSF